MQRFTKVSDEFSTSRGDEFWVLGHEVKSGRGRRASCLKPLPPPLLFQRAIVELNSYIGQTWDGNCDEYSGFDLFFINLQQMYNTIAMF